LLLLIGIDREGDDGHGKHGHEGIKSVSAHEKLLTL
jgi:hypothetical protein